MRTFPFTMVVLASLAVLAQNVEAAPPPSRGETWPASNAFVRVGLKPRPAHFYKLIRGMDLPVCRDAAELFSLPYDPAVKGMSPSQNPFWHEDVLLGTPSSVQWQISPPGSDLEMVGAGYAEVDVNNSGRTRTVFRQIGTLSGWPKHRLLIFDSPTAVPARGGASGDDYQRTVWEKATHTDIAEAYDNAANEPGTAVYLDLIEIKGKVYFAATRFGADRLRKFMVVGELDAHFAPLVRCVFRADR